jgi:AraC-like DNA-binding protein
MDNREVLTEVFQFLRLTSRPYFEADLRGNFAVRVPRERRLVRFHLVREGRCLVRVAGGPAAALGEGDLAIVPNGAEQVLSREPDTAPVDLGDLLGQGALEGGVLTSGPGPRGARLLCGFCRFDEAIDHPVMANLPALMVVRQAELGAEPWAAATLRLIGLEADLGAPGTTGILGRLLEIVFIQAVRRMTSSDGASANGFMAALTDPQLARALHAIHGEPDRPWRLGDLARIAGMSRARFADRFTRTVGRPAIDYLTTWRLIKGRDLLAGTKLDMAEIAARCGYASVSSFTKRFKKAFGLGPGAFRREGGQTVSVEIMPPG